MYYRVNKNKEIIELLKGYYPGYHNDLAKVLERASDEQLKLYAVPVAEIVELKGNVSGSLFLDSGTARFVASGGAVTLNIAAVKEEAARKAAELCDAAIRPLLDKYPQAEVLTFPVKRGLAVKWLSLSAEEKEAALQDSAFALIVNEAGAIASAAEVDALCGKIMANAERFDVHCGMCFRVKKSVMIKIESFKGDAAELEKLVSTLAFPSAL